MALFRVPVRWPGARAHGKAEGRAEKGRGLVRGHVLSQIKVARLQSYLLRSVSIGPAVGQSLQCFRPCRIPMVQRGGCCVKAS